MNTVSVPPTTTNQRTLAVSGSAHICFKRAGFNTILERSFATSPVKLFSTRSHAGACWVYAASLGGGFVGGDAVRIRIDVGPEANALLTTQASTKVYRSLKPASQMISAVIHEDALLAVIPDPVVCFADADFSQDQHYTLTNRSNLVVVDWITSGRHAVGERWAFTNYTSRIHVMREGRLVFYDAISLRREANSIADRMGRFDVCATCLIMGPRVATAAAAIVSSVSRQPVVSRADTVESAWALGDRGMMLRIAGTSVELVGRLIRLRLRFLYPFLGDDPWSRKW